MKSFTAPQGAKRGAHRPLDIAQLIEEEELAADAPAEPEENGNDGDCLAPLAHFRAERCLRGRSAEEDWIAARVEADGQPEWREVFKEIENLYG